MQSGNPGTRLIEQGNASIRKRESHNNNSKKAYGGGAVGDDRASRGPADGGRGRTAFHLFQIGRRVRCECERCSFPSLNKINKRGNCACKRGRVKRGCEKSSEAVSGANHQPIAVFIFMTS